MTDKTDLPTTKTLSTEEMKLVRGGLLLNRYSLRRSPTTSSRSGRFGIVAMSGFIGSMTFDSFGITQMSG